MAENFREADRHRHRPPANAPANWQESFFLGWADLETLSAGSHHISLSPATGTAHVWSWIVVNGERVAREAAHALPLPENDLTNIQLGGLHFVAGESARQLTLQANFEDAQLRLGFEAICDPVILDFNVGDTRLADRHYEVMGYAKGSFTSDKLSTPIRAAAWHDHSWGARDFGTNPSSRWLFAVFGDDLAFSIFSFVTSFGAEQFGWVLDNGRVHRISRANFSSMIANDGATPLSVEIDCWTDDGRGYRLSGDVKATGLTGGEGWFGVDGITEFQCGGRLGQGFFEPAELKGPTPQMRKELGLP
ncbi:hypothetical protein DXH95_02400 [Sphingorhabdus pulchriflava]|uniref:AttH domain-containing protein n=1 Tax=Sphingorhabdus pulchriflava TaxID=2292257 RepID=A0A371BFC0_9SPHN|nr:hypothetical protein [Sphingorhabdus pulchriflava]RDV06305.1 hypothetical protein DXH95_02400 [Sphingorhabdus pulchriflava]